MGNITMTTELRNFIETHEQDINNHNWNNVYDDILDDDLTGEFTSCLLDIGIDPAKEMQVLPRSYLYGSQITDYVVPKNIEIIESGAFWNCAKLKNIVFKGDLKSVKNSAFNYCFQLENVIFQGNVGVIGAYSFDACKNLTEVKFYKSLQEIRHFAFYQCTEIKNIVLPDGLEHIGRNAFSNCHGLNSVTLPKTLTTMEPLVFSDCNNLNSIKYLGTKKQWDNIHKQNWSINSSVEVINCSDGDIDI